MDKYTGKKLDGRYEIRELIGVGGMANVYHCYDTIDAREVAIKILKDEYLDNEDFIRRFKNESKAIAVLNHPNIVRVYDVSFGDMIQYIVMYRRYHSQRVYRYAKGPRLERNRSLDDPDPESLTARA